MPLARLGTSLVYFAHVPKTGGSSVTAYLAARGRVALYHAKALDWLPCSPQHIHADLQKILFPQGFADHSFTILRDPVARMQSEYAFRARRAARHGRGIRGFDQWVPHVLERYPGDPYMLDNHLRPQSAFVLPGMTLFRYEDGLDRVFDWLDSLAGDAPPAHREWQKKTGSEAITMRPETEARIRAAYEVDYAFLAGARFA